MSKPEPSMDAWLAEAKANPQAAQCGMYLVHNGVVRETAKAQVREGESKPPVAQVDFSYDKEGLQAAHEGEESLFPMSLPMATYDLDTREPHDNYVAAINTVSDILRDAGIALA